MKALGMLNSLTENTSGLLERHLFENDIVSSVKILGHCAKS